MWSSSSLSPDRHDALLQRFLVASRRGEIVDLINSARTEADLGAVVAAELCEAFEAEIAFVVVAGPASGELVGGVGLLGEDAKTVLAHPSCWDALSGAVAIAEHGSNLLGIGLRDVALAPRTTGAGRLLIGVGRLYEHAFGELELALLEAVTKSAAAALERFGLERQLQQAQEMEAVARMAGGIAQEFNGALATIVDLCDRASDGVNRRPFGVEAQLSEIRAAAASATELAEYLLAFSRQPQLQSVALELNGGEAGSRVELPALTPP